MKKIARCVGLGAVLLGLPLVGRAGTVAVVDTEGGGGGLGTTLEETLRAELVGHTTMPLTRPGAWKSAKTGGTARVAGAARDAQVDIVVDSVVVKRGKQKSLELLAVTAAGWRRFRRAVGAARR